MIVAANWKMNPSLEGAGALAQALISRRFEAVQRYLFAPHPYLVPMSIRLQGSDVVLGGQDCHADTAGAHTGDVSAAMLRDCGAAIALVGHSERRADHGETSALVRAKAEQALAHDLAVMICVGETLAEREAGQAEQVVIDQLRASMPHDVPSGRVLIAYEPVWAIGTGATATPEDAQEMCAHVRDCIRQISGKATAEMVRVQYGGSVKPVNIAELMSQDDIDGALVGGAALEAESFARIAQYRLQ